MIITILFSILAFLGALFETSWQDTALYGALFFTTLSGLFRWKTIFGEKEGK